MTKFVIAAATAALLASTSVSFAEGDSGRDTYQSALSFNLQPVATQQVNNVRNARAQITSDNHAVKPFTADEAAWFARANPQTAN
jgi:hypothetical protein